MKITRLESGYRIRLSDSEFAALKDVTTRGEADYAVLTDDEWANLAPDVKRGLKTITGTGSWTVDDRRVRSRKGSPV